jgi:hypothetical protein
MKPFPAPQQQRHDLRVPVSLAGGQRLACKRVESCSSILKPSPHVLQSVTATVVLAGLLLLLSPADTAAAASPAFRWARRLQQADVAPPGAGGAGGGAPPESPAPPGAAGAAAPPFSLKDTLPSMNVSAGRLTMVSQCAWPLGGYPPMCQPTHAALLTEDVDEISDKNPGARHVARPCMRVVCWGGGRRDWGGARALVPRRMYVAHHHQSVMRPAPELLVCHIASFKCATRPAARAAHTHVGFRPS